jgi:hypothetical protein
MLVLDNNQIEVTHIDNHTTSKVNINFYERNKHLFVPADEYFIKLGDGTHVPNIERIDLARSYAKKLEAPGAVEEAPKVMKVQRKARKKTTRKK